jgi:hypothetical protein
MQAKVPGVTGLRSQVSGIQGKLDSQDSYPTRNSQEFC